MDKIVYLKHNIFVVKFAIFCHFIKTYAATICLIAHSGASAEIYPEGGGATEKTRPKNRHH